MDRQRQIEEHLGWGSLVVSSNLLDPVDKRLELHGIMGETFRLFSAGHSLSGNKAQQSQKLVGNSTFVRNSGVYIRPRGPFGGLSGVYFPVRAPESRK